MDRSEIYVFTINTYIYNENMYIKWTDKDVSRKYFSFKYIVFSTVII